MKECTFKPHISKMNSSLGSPERLRRGEDSVVFNNLYNHAKNKVVIERSQEEIIWEKEKGECTFQPNKELRRKERTDKMKKHRKRSIEDINVASNESVEKYIQSLLNEGSQTPDG